LSYFVGCGQIYPLDHFLPPPPYHLSPLRLFGPLKRKSRITPVQPKNLISEFLGVASIAA